MKIMEVIYIKAVINKCSTNCQNNHNKKYMYVLMLLQRETLLSVFLITAGLNIEQVYKLLLSRM